MGLIIDSSAADQGVQSPGTNLASPNKIYSKKSLLVPCLLLGTHSEDYKHNI